MPAAGTTGPGWTGLDWAGPASAAQVGDHAPWSGIGRRPVPSLISDYNRPPCSAELGNDLKKKPVREDGNPKMNKKNCAEGTVEYH